MKLMKYLFRGIGLTSSLSLFVLGLATTIYAFVEGYHVIDEILKFSSSEAHVISDAMSLLDLILLGFSIFITSIGIFELFVHPVKDLPEWMQVKNLDDLNSMLVKVIIVVMGISFMGRAVTWDGQANLLNYGIAIASVILALSYFLSTKKNLKSKTHPH